MTGVITTHVARPGHRRPAGPRRRRRRDRHAPARTGLQSRRPARLVGRLRIDGVDPAVEEAVDAALDAAGVHVREVRLPGWGATFGPFDTILPGEMWRAHRTLLDAGGVGASVNGCLRAGRKIGDARLAEAMSARPACGSPGRRAARNWSARPGSRSSAPCGNPIDRVGPIRKARSSEQPAP
ncbi:hypothetical protein [Actinoplanes sp. NPDC051411]|uniref:hypothetical protein n=1 Tax=Actinoplanes sp. NPDC051411 TaxID=3155522 RepID=UPI0034143C11